MTTDYTDFTDQRREEVDLNPEKYPWNP